METRIVIPGRGWEGDRIRYCSVDADPNNYAHLHDDVESCMEDVARKIIQDGESRNYTHPMIDLIISHYWDIFYDPNIQWGKKEQIN